MPNTDTTFDPAFATWAAGQAQRGLPNAWLERLWAMREEGISLLEEVQGRLLLMMNNRRTLSRSRYTIPESQARCIILGHGGQIIIPEKPQAGLKHVRVGHAIDLSSAGEGRGTTRRMGAATCAYSAPVALLIDDKCGAVMFHLNAIPLVVEQAGLDLIARYSGFTNWAELRAEWAKDGAGWRYGWQITWGDAFVPAPDFSASLH